MSRSLKLTLKSFFLTRRKSSLIFNLLLLVLLILCCLLYASLPGKNSARSFDVDRQVPRDKRELETFAPSVSSLPPARHIEEPQFLYPNEGLCKDKGDHHVIILVPSRIKSYQQRVVVRETWANASSYWQSILWNYTIVFTVSYIPHNLRPWKV